MPVSKRDKKVSLTKTRKKGMKLKQELVENIRKSLDKYNNLFIFTVNNLRNGLLKELREQWIDSRFFLAKRKVMALALGRTEAEEVQKNLHKLAMMLVGECGLLFTNRPKGEVLQFFSNYLKMDYARSGFVPTETVTLPAGPLPGFIFSIEPHLRQLGLPTKLEKGMVILREQHIVCTEGSPLTSDQANLLKLLGKQMAEFKLTLVCMWSKDGSFEKFKVRTKHSPKGVKETTKKITELSIQEAKTTKQVIEIHKQEEKSPIQVAETPKQKEKKSKLITESPEPTERALTQTTEAPELDIKTPKKVTKIFKPQTPKPMEEGNSEPSKEPNQVKKSPNVGRQTPRRSMRTPKPIIRTPDLPKQSVKKLTVSASKLKSTPKQLKGTPKQRSTNKTRTVRPQNKSVDVEMAE